MPEINRSRNNKGGRGSGVRHRGGSKQRPQMTQQPCLPFIPLLVILKGMATWVQWDSYPVNIVCEMANQISLPSTDEESRKLLASLGLAHLQTTIYIERASAQDFFGTRSTLDSSIKKDRQDFYGFANGEITNMQQLQHTILLVRFLIAFYKANPSYENFSNQNGIMILQYIMDVEVILSIVKAKNASRYKELISPRNNSHCYPARTHN